MLPRYPSDEVVIMEFLRQAHDVHTVLRNRKKPVLSFPFGLGIYTCRLVADAKSMGDELSKLGLKPYNERRSYDPHGVFAAQLEKNYAHLPALEDFWANCRDEFEVRRRSYSRLTLHQMKDYLAKDIEGLLDDDGDVLLPMYTRNQIEDQPLPQVNWANKESLSVEERTRQVLKHSKVFLVLKRKKSIPTEQPPRVQLSLPSSSRAQSKGKGVSQSQEGVKGSRSTKNARRWLYFSGIVI